MQRTMSFHNLEELLTNSTLWGLENYVPTQREMAKIIKFAEKFQESGIVTISYKGRTFLVCNKVYDYYENAKLQSDDSGRETYFLSLNVEPFLSSISVPVSHAYYRHIFWDTEFPELLDKLSEAEFKDEDEDQEWEDYGYNPENEDEYDEDEEEEDYDDDFTDEDFGEFKEDYAFC